MKTAGFEEERNIMIDSQLIARGISDDRVLEAFRRVPRHLFMPEGMRSNAYSDFPLPIGEGQTISQPYMVALMTELAVSVGAERVLEIGTGSGYQLAILANIAREVYSIERFDSLILEADKTLSSLGYSNYKIRPGDGTLGWKEYAPYDAIIVTAGSPTMPKTLFNQLKDNGRLVIPIGDKLSQVLTLIRRKGGNAEATSICGCVFVPLIGKEGWQK